VKGCFDPLVGHSEIMLELGPSQIIICFHYISSVSENNNVVEEKFEKQNICRPRFRFPSVI
jgi:hypothetical protein